MQAKFKRIPLTTRKLRYFFLKGILFFFVFAAVGGAVLFIDFTYKTFSLRPQPLKTDAIVVLAGGRGRIEEGIRLYRARQATYLFLVGVDPAVKKETLIKHREGDPPLDGVIIEQASRNTLENALYSRELIEQRPIRSLRLITSRYHMKRATLIFSSTFPNSIKIYSHPVDSKNLQEKWWSHGGSFRLLFTEFYKYCLYRFVFLFDVGEFKA